MKKGLTLLLLCTVLLGYSAPVFAVPLITLPNPLCLNPQPPPPPGTCVPSATCICTFTQLIEKVIDFVVDVMAVLAILMFVIAGIYFVISAGDAGKIQTAKNIAIYAVVGLAISIAARSLIAVIRAVVGAPSP